MDRRGALAVGFKRARNFGPAWIMGRADVAHGNAWLNPVKSAHGFIVSMTFQGRPWNSLDRNAPNAISVS
jgi:hypothetical protein